MFPYTYFTDEPIAINYTSLDWSLLVRDSLGTLKVINIVLPPNYHQPLPQPPIDDADS